MLDLRDAIVPSSFWDRLEQSFRTTVQQSFRAENQASPIQWSEKSVESERHVKIAAEH